MEKYEETFDTWNKVALLYQEKFMYLDIYNESYDFFLKRLSNQNAQILEVGCGPGNITKYLLTKNQKLKILGIDVAPNMISLAQQNNPTAEFIAMDCRNLDAIKGFYDGIIGGFVMPYIATNEVEKWIENLVFKLVSKGLLYMSFVEGMEEQSGFVVGSSGDRCFFYYHELEKILYCLENCKMSVLDVLKIDYQKNDTCEVHTVVIARKK